MTELQTVDLLSERSSQGIGSVVVTANLDHLRRCRKDKDYRDLVAEADIVVADGMPLVWASRVQGGNQILERVAGSTMMFSLCQRAADDGLSIYLLGGYPEDVASQAGEALKLKYPGLQIAGTHCPAFGFEHDKEQLDAIAQMLRSASPDIVYVALGSPKQEVLIRTLRDILPDAIWIGIGISLSFAIGEVQRAPVLLQKLGLEWVHRLCQEPKRLFRRYIIDGLPFAAILFANALFSRVSRSSVRYDE
ncbi:MAG: WecB/TagA/CpsF family glycosyltransferase [Phycisphaerales bacterium]|nr:WecB/TagA/CpsF family glycosyltransferase [Phycisphaerales bacterium]